MHLARPLAGLPCIFFNLIPSVFYIGLFLLMEKIVRILLFIPKWADEHILFEMAVLVVSLPHLIFEYICMYVVLLLHF